MSFSPDFTWGAAAAAYQIEGAAKQGGRGPDVWDMFARQPGRVQDLHNGDVGTDHYNRLEEDLDLFRQTGIQAYRLSLAWPRILPEGTGRINEEGLAFYDRLIDGLLKRGITPWVTLFHWDYPLELYYRGGWLNRDSVEWFADYAGVVVDRLGDRVKHWMTVNEPQCFIGLGYQQGVHAPGRKYHWPEVIRCWHHMLLAHGRSVDVLRAGSPGAQVGAAPVFNTHIPVSDSPADIETARSHTLVLQEKDLWNTACFADPVFLGQYSDEYLSLHAEDLEGVIREGDMEVISRKLDFFGFNIYSGKRIRTGPDGGAVHLEPGPGAPATTMHWAVEPTSLYWATKWMYETFGLPVVVTENGLANNDWVHLDGKVHDPQRIDFVSRYLREYHRAISEGANALGYFHWSIMDNFEWAFGYNRRFGLIHVDYDTQARTLKDSAHWYRTVVESNGEVILD